MLNADRGQRQHPEAANGQKTVRDDPQAGRQPSEYSFDLAANTACWTNLPGGTFDLRNTAHLMPLKAKSEERKP